MRKYVITVLIGLMVFIAACGDKDEAGKVVVSGKKYTEQIIIANIVGEFLIANTDLDVTIEDGLGSVFVLHEAMKKGEIDMYVEYTGTGFEVIEETFDPSMSKDEVYQKNKDEYQEQFNMKWLEPLGFNNTYTLTMRSELYDELSVDTYSELTDDVPNLSFGADAEVFERADGYDGLVEAYDYDEFEDKVSIDPDLMYEAAQNGEIDIIAAFSTDPRIDQFDLKTLEDDKGFFPPYDAAVVVRQEILDANPELEDKLNELAGTFTDEKMRELNGRVNLDGKKDNEVAKEFLEEEGFLD